MLTPEDRTHVGELNMLNKTRTIHLNIDERQYRGLRFEAQLISGVFGLEVTPEDVARERLSRSARRLTAHEKKAAR